MQAQRRRFSAVMLADADLLSYWRLGEAAASATVADSKDGVAGTVSGGTLGVPGLLAGDSDTAWASDASIDCHIDFGEVYGFAGSAPFAVEFLLDDPTSVGNNSIIGRFTVSANGWQINHFASGNLLSLVRWDAAGADQLDYNRSLDPTPSLYRITYDGSDGRIYSNGVLVAGPTPMRAIVDPGVGVSLKVGKIGPYSGFDGTIDEVAIFGAAGDDATALAHAQAAGLA